MAKPPKVNIIGYHTFYHQGIEKWIMNVDIFRVYRKDLSEEGQYAFGKFGPKYFIGQSSISTNVLLYIEND